MIIKKTIYGLAGLVLLTTVAACDTAEQRAEKHFQSAMQLLEQGDQERAIVEFRNVFQLDGQHREARTAFAKLQLDRGDIRGAFGQYLKLVEQYPNDLDALKTLSELSMQTGSWDQLERHVPAALALAPDDTVLKSLQIMLDYRDAIEAKDDLAQAQSVAAADELQAQDPENTYLRQLRIDNMVKKSDFSGALAELDIVIAANPQNEQMQSLKLSLLGQLGVTSEIEAQLVEMVREFPENDQFKVTLIQWFVGQGKLDQAEEYLRSNVDPNSDDPAPQLTLIRFLSELRGPEAAIAELDTIIPDAKSPAVFRALRAGLIFESGQTEQAIKEMEDILSSETEEDVSNIRVGLARMLIATGNSVGARSLVEETLESDASNVAALKLKAAFLIDGDEVGEAIVTLRTALDASPRDAEIMTLLARAYERDGNQELVGEMLSLAVEASNNAPNNSIAYAKYLAGREKFITAEEVLIDALRLSPDNVPILGELGNLYISMKDFARAEQVVGTLGRLELPAAEQVANNLNAGIIGQRDDPQAVISFMESLLDQGGAGIGANMAIIRTLLQQGKNDEALARMDELQADAPEDPSVRFISAAVKAAVGESDGAEQIFEELVEEDPSRSRVWMALIQLNMSQGKTEAAEKVVDRAISENPNEPTLQWAKAGMLEQNGDLPGAIAIYEAMYDQNSSNLVVANNLASLLTTNSDTPEVVDRAYTIAKRLRGNPAPPFQDTFGWIAFLRGEFDVALESLSPAAIGLPKEALVQYHLAKAYAATNQNEEALAQYSKVLLLVGEADTRDFVVESRQEIIRLQK